LYPEVSYNSPEYPMLVEQAGNLKALGFQEVEVAEAIRISNYDYALAAQELLKVGLRKQRER
jgi:hypothetical protein